jgi:hypothetical protein
MSSQEPRSYDAREARDILGRSSVGSDATHVQNARNAASHQLVHQFAQLEEIPGIAIKELADGRARCMAYGLHSVDVFVEDREVTIARAPRSASKQRVDLVFNRATNMLEGRDFDRTVCPVPGQPLPRRSALAVLAEAVLALMNQSATP